MMKWWLLTDSGLSGDSTFIFFRGVELPLKAVTTILQGGRRELLCAQLYWRTSNSDMGYDTVYLSATSNPDASKLMWSVTKIQNMMYHYSQLATAIRGEDEKQFTTWQVLKTTWKSFTHKGY